MMKSQTDQEQKEPISSMDTTEKITQRKVQIIGTGQV